MPSFTAGFRRKMDRMEQENKMNEEKLWSFLTEAGIVKKIILLEETDSTNRIAKELARQGAPEGTLVTANMQSAGRGRLGRSFYSPAGSGIYTSMVLRPSLCAEQALRITSCAAVAVARAIEKVTGAFTQIKWVNDVYLNGKKVCGILTEAAFGAEGTAMEFAVLGIGVNVGTMQFPEELAEIATSLEKETGQSIDRNKLLAEIWNEFAVLYEQIEQGTFLEESKARSMVLGKQIVVHAPEGSYEAKAVDLNEEGHLLIEKNGIAECLYSGEISVRVKEREKS